MTALLLSGLWIWQVNIIGQTLIYLDTQSLSEFSALHWDIAGALHFVVLTGWLCGLLSIRRKLLQQLLLASLVYAALLFSYSRLSLQSAALSLIASVLPAVTLSYATLHRIWPILRSILQSFIWASTLLWVMPTLIFSITGQSWQALVERPPMESLLLSLPLIIPFAILCSALLAFARDGNGTAFPYDAPDKLVSTGIYAYLSNPMQLGVCLLLMYWGVFVNSIIVSLTAVIALMLFEVYKHICNGSCTITGSDAAWFEYHKRVRQWLPRLPKN